MMNKMVKVFVVLCLAAVMLAFMVACDPPPPTATPGINLLVETLVASVTPAAYPIPLR